MSRQDRDFFALLIVATGAVVYILLTIQLRGIDNLVQQAVHLCGG